MLRWAAGIAAFFVMAFVIYSLYHKEAVKQITRSTLSSKDSLLLADGSKIYLDAYSSITYPAQFDPRSRTVSFLKGTAFFKIADDQARPFTVVMGHAAVRILGTSFNISKAEKQINVDVKTGRIMFLVNEKARAVLSAGTAGCYDLSADSIRTFSNQHQNNDAWLTGELHFVDEPLSKVFEKLEACYHVQIDLDTNLAKLGKFNATFTNSNLDEVITLLERTYPIVIIKKGNKLMIRNK
jgi:ferric-dicitrate binding protein FerR (iron transport regulator)